MRQRGGIAYFVRRALPGTGMERGRIPPLSMLLSTAALIGLIIGCMVPTWYRSAMRRRLAEPGRHDIAADGELPARVRLSQGWRAPIVTELVPLDRFYPAEEYHQDYCEQNPRQRYCQIAPRLPSSARSIWHGSSGRLRGAWGNSMGRAAGGINSRTIGTSTITGPHWHR